jgi:unsaturated rhamnogalacturonyl hydrolase
MDKRNFVKYKIPYLEWTIFIFVGSSVWSSVTSAQLPSKAEVISSMVNVNAYWINGHLDPGDWEWNRAAYFTGNMGLYQAYPDPVYLDYALKWADQNDWGLKGGPLTRFADNQCIGQTYLDLYEIEKDPAMIEDIQTSIENMVLSEKKDDWYWIDAFYMAMPVFARLGVLNGDDAYFEKMYDLYADTKFRRGLFDESFGLWFRDENYDPPYQTPNGKNCYWSRGNGWVFAAHVRVLQHLPGDDPHRAEYISTFQVMAATLKEVQRPDGFWNVSLADPDDFGGPETSGTAFFTYGMAWGINNRLLDSATYYPVVEKAWTGLVSTAVHPDGKLGYVQLVGKEPASSQPVTYESTADFGVGAFLLAGTEVYKMAGGEWVTPPVSADNIALNRLHDFSDQQTDNLAVNAVDGDALTRWSARYFPQWIEIDMGGLYRIYRTEIVPYQNRAYQYMISGKENAGDDDSLLVDRRDNQTGGSVLTDTLDNVIARYLKLTVTGCHDYTGDWVSLMEFRVFGGPATGTQPMMVTSHARLYPNPASRYVWIELDPVPEGVIYIGIINSMGKTMLEKRFARESYSRTLTEMIDLSGFESGMYVLTIRAGRFYKTEKLIINTICNR